MTRAKRPPATLGDTAAWEDAEVFPAKILREALGPESCDAAVDALAAPWRAFRASRRMAAAVRSPVEQSEVATGIAAACRDLARVLRTADPQHAEAAAWLAASRDGCDLGDAKVATAAMLVNLSRWYATAAQAAIPLPAKPRQGARDALARAVLDAVTPLTETEQQRADIVAAVLEAAGAQCPADITRYCRRIRQ